jgi:hypothetical protein
MKWKCPDCGLENSDKFLECTCGYAFYKILGVTPGASREEVDQTYQYLKKVWDKNIQSRDPSLKQKAQERIKKIEEAYGIYKYFVTGSPEVEKKPPYIKIASIAAIAIIILAGVLIFFYLFRKDTTRDQSALVQKEDITTSGQFGGEYVPEGAQDKYLEEDYPVEETQPYDRFSTDITSLTAKEKAIELVKRSRGIDRFYSDESQISDWEAKEIDDQRYLVSFNASKGSDTNAFYFDTNIKTGSVRPITDRHELQQYGIQQADFARYRLDITVPEYVRENRGFEAQVTITGKPNMKMPVSEKMFFILSNGCEVVAIRGTSPRRMSDILPEYQNVKGTPRDPYIPSGEFIVLNSQGSLEIPVTLKAGPYSDRLPRVGTGSEERGCILEVSIGSFAQVETWVVVEKQ